MRTEYNLEALETALGGNCGDFYGACRECGLSLQFVRTWMADDAKVNERIRNAQNLGATALESEAIRRAVHGDEETVFNKQGDASGTRTKRSDALLITLLKGKMKETYAENGGGGFVNNGIIVNAMPRANNFEEWLQMAGSLQKELVEQKRLEAQPPQVEDAEFEVVLPPPELDPRMQDIL